MYKAGFYGSTLFRRTNDLIIFVSVKNLNNMEMFRKLTIAEIERLENQGCTSSGWEQVEVSEGFSADYICNTRFSGRIRLGAFTKEFILPGGMKKHSGIYYATLHNVTVGDDCCIENVKNYIANYEIGAGSFIENVDIILVDGTSSFGNGVEVSVQNMEKKERQRNG